MLDMRNPDCIRVHVYAPKCNDKDNNFQIKSAKGQSEMRAIYSCQNVNS